MKCRLKGLGWNEEARSSLERAIQRGAGQRLPVVFDFDNTIVSGDVGEAALALLAAEGRLSPKSVCKSLCPVLTPPGGKRHAIEDCSNVMEYYEALLAPTAHGPADPTPLANGYVWATEVMEKLTVAEVLAATARVYELGQANPIAQIKVTPGKPTYPPPRFYSEMVELIGLLLRLKYDVWIVSASNVWSVRWLVLHGLNPLLKAQGIDEGLRPDHVIGVATLLADPDGHLYKDSVLVRQNVPYAVLETKTAKALQITRHLQFPAPVYSGKVACILDAIGRTPYLCAGDSLSDHPMLKVSQYRLWIARWDKPDAQRATKAMIQQTGQAGWIVQAVQSGGEVRFIPSRDGTFVTSKKAPAKPQKMREGRVPRVPNCQKRLKRGTRGSRPSNR